MPVKLGRSWSKVVDNLVKKVIIVQSTVRRIRIRHDGRLEVSLERVIAISDHERLPRNEWSDSQPQNRISIEDINRTMLQLFRQYLLTMDK